MGGKCCILTADFYLLGHQIVFCKFPDGGVKSGNKRI
jgi:hypothetical protein